MFKPISAPEHVIAMQLSGELTSEDINQYQSLFGDKLKQHQQLSLCIDFTGLADMTADALVAGTKADLELLSHLNQFSRCACKLGMSSLNPSLARNLFFKQANGDTCLNLH